MAVHRVGDLLPPGVLPSFVQRALDDPAEPFSAADASNAELLALALDALMRETGFLRAESPATKGSNGSTFKFEYQILNAPAANGGGNVGRCSLRVYTVRSAVLIYGQFSEPDLDTYRSDDKHSYSISDYVRSAEAGIPLSQRYVNLKELRRRFVGEVALTMLYHGHWALDTPFEDLPSNNLAKLPDVALESVCLALPSVRDVDRLLMTCKALHARSTDDWPWQKICKKKSMSRLPPKPDSCTWKQWTRPKAVIKFGPKKPHAGPVLVAALPPAPGHQAPVLNVGGPGGMPMPPGHHGPVLNVGGPGGMPMPPGHHGPGAGGPGLALPPVPGHQGPAGNVGGLNINP